jgi:tetratricopeptide (TPR) repeat protein
MKTFFTLVCVLLTSPLFAQLTRFTVTVPGGVLKPGDAIHVHGSDASLGSWVVGPRMTLQTIGIETQAHLEVELQDGTGAIEYKYVIHRADGRLEWEPSANRRRMLTDSGRNSQIDMLAGYEGALLSAPVTVRFRFLAEGFTVNGITPDSIGVVGGRWPLVFGLGNEITQMSNIGTSDGAWVTSVEFPTGSPVDVPFKFVWKADGVWYYEFLPGHINHIALLDPDVRQAVITMRMDTERHRVVPLSATGALVDDYARVHTEYGNKRPYGYDLAITQLDAGRTDQAIATYDGFISAYRGSVLIDDFDYMRAGAMADAGQIEDALAFAKAKGAQQTDAQRRGYFEYLQGEILLNADQPQRSRAHFRRAEAMMRAGEPDQMVTGYARMALAISYMAESEPDSLVRARSPLMALARTHPDASMRRQAWGHLDQVATQIGDHSLAMTAQTALDSVGTREQIVRGQIHRMQMLLENTDPAIVERMADELDQSLSGTSIQWDVRLLRALALEQMGEAQAARTLRNQVAREAKSGSAASREAHRSLELQP